MAETTPKNPSKPPAAAGQTGDGIRETFESIIIALILAFVFRAFIVEAFVIPTGSMAHTLNGEHNTHVCTNCGFEYIYGRMRNEQNQLADVPPRSACPNCGFLDETVPDEYREPLNGDRILVLKWPFDLGIKALGPKRWEPTVFKDPSDGRTNFIKRLVGMPREVFEIIDGDVYTAPIDNLPDETVAAMDRIRHLRYVLLNEQPPMEERFGINRELAGLLDQVLPELDRCYHIQRKTADVTRAQQALWTIVFDQDYLPTQRAGVGWTPYAPHQNSDWDTSQRTIRFDGVNTERQSIRLTGKPATDNYAYDFDGISTNRRTGNIVADRRLQGLFIPQRGDGRFDLRLTKYNTECVAAFDVADQTVTLTLTTRTDDKVRSVEVGSKPVALSPGQPVEVALSNVDYRVAVCVNDHELLATTDRDYAPDIAALRTRPTSSRRTSYRREPEPVAELGAERIDLLVRHLHIDRDVYYTNASISAEVRSARVPNRWNPFAAPDYAEANGNRVEVPGWGTENNPIMLRDGEYFMLGDNSPQSKDSRMWWEVAPVLAHRGEKYQAGTVPKDQLIGRAFFVYWPSGYKPAWTMHIGLIPNVGRMRWIR